MLWLNILSKDHKLCLVRAVRAVLLELFLKILRSALEGKRPKKL